MTLEDDRGSLATIGSDEEPLEGDTSEHVEAMLRACLDPDERQLSDDDDDDHVVDPLLYKSSQIEAAAELDLKSLADSELDELDELTLAHEHAQALADALDEFSVHADHALSDAHAPPPPPPPPAAAAPPPASVPARVRALRERSASCDSWRSTTARSTRTTRSSFWALRARRPTCARARTTRRSSATGSSASCGASARGFAASSKRCTETCWRRRARRARRRRAASSSSRAAQLPADARRRRKRRVGACARPPSFSALVEPRDRAVRELAAPPAPVARAASPPRRRPRPSGLEAAYAPTPRTRRTNETSRASTERGGAADLPTAPPADGGGPWQVLRLPAVQAALADQLWTLLSRRVPGHETHR